MRARPDVAVVEAHDVVAAGGQVLAELVRPGEHLRAQPHDQQQRRLPQLAEGLVRDLDAVRRHPLQLRHAPER